MKVVSCRICRVNQVKIALGSSSQCGEVCNRCCDDCTRCSLNVKQKAEVFDHTTYKRKKLPTSTY